MQQSLPLKDIHLPDAVSAWPPALGWWLLLALCLLCFIAYIYYQRSQAKRLLKKNIISEFNQIKTHFNENDNAAELARKLSVLMRRISIQYLDRQQTASLIGDDWLRFLDQLHHSPAFSAGAGRVLLNAPYQAQTSFDTDALLTLCEECIQNLPAAKTTLKISQASNTL
jgi:hypothetical protein